MTALRNPNPAAIRIGPLSRLLAALLWAAAGSLSVTPAQAQPAPDTSVDALVRALAAAPPTRAFRRTQPPEAGTNLCPEQAPAGTGGGAGAGPGTRSPGATRNLEVVPYAGDTAPGVNLNLQFTHASDKLAAPDRALLDNLAAALQRPELARDRFAVAGHTDTTGDARVNLELSCARALSARRYLAGKGVAESRLSAYGFGSSRLLPAQEPTASAQRRVEIRRAPEP